MNDTSSSPVPKQGIFRRLVAGAMQIAEALEYTSVDYTHDRIDRLERTVAELAEALRERHASGSRDSSPGWPKAKNHAPPE